ncbi:hypothetical protein X975_12319, partial [Stegodyphus mimosarum]
MAYPTDSLPRTSLSIHPSSISSSPSTTSCQAQNTHSIYISPMPLYRTISCGPQICQQLLILL